MWYIISVAIQRVKMVLVQVYTPNVGWSTQRKTRSLIVGLSVFDRNVDDLYCSRVLIDGNEFCQYFGLRSPMVQPELNDELEEWLDYAEPLQLGLTF